jgi:integrase
MKKKRLTDRTVQTLKATGRPYDVMDLDVRGFGVRVDAQGRRSFVLITRYPGKRHPARRVIGEYGVISLAEAREKARGWRKMIAEGMDPSVERNRISARQEAFGTVAEAYFAHIKRQGLRRAWEVQRDIRREFAPWWKWSITDIKRQDVLAIVEAALARDAPWEAHHVLSYASRLFNWAIERGTIESSPCDRLRPAKVIGRKIARSRVLTDDELIALWRASRRIGYPFGHLVRMLTMSGQRRTEVAEARWSEIDLKQRLWTIPRGRMKGDAAHTVPLTEGMIALLEALPRFNRGDYLFSTTFGVKAVNGFSKAKQRLDHEMVRTLRAMARMRGEDAPTLEPFVLHDIRRSVRTRLSALPIPDLVRELVIGHTKPGLHKVYDLHAYEDEKRHALELWGARLRSIVERAATNVVPLRAEA